MPLRPRLLFFPVTVILISFALTLPVASEAELYKWRDAEGTLHVTDDLHKVPRDKRRSVETLPTVSRPGAESRGGTRTSPGYSDDFSDDGYEETRGIELYGGESFEWWTDEFERLNGKIEWLERNNKNMEEYIKVFEGGRRFGQVFGADETARYKENKRDLPEDKALLIEVKQELEKLKTEATGYGIPEEIINSK
ncbi:MAG: DUF4124 domain-containing protein [Proteobacteria bacterium]|nr:DUF4124 domain-containing protein [Pseudomonadota bacterium]